MSSGQRLTTSDRPDSPDANPSGLDHHEVAADLYFFKRLDSRKDLRIESICRDLIREMSDHDTGVTPWRVCDDVREAAVSGDKHCIPILSRSEDFLVWTTTQADIPHIEGIMSCRV